MKTAKYESSGGALLAYLAGKPKSAAVCDLYTFQFAGSINGGIPLTFATSDVDIVVPYAAPVTYSSKLLYIDQIANKAYGHWKVGVDVDTWQVVMTPTSQATIGGQPFLQAIRAGALDGATILVDRAFFDNRPGGLPQGASSLTPLGVVNIFTGRMAEIDFGRSAAIISINSHLELLNVQMPRNLFGASCRWTVYSPGCTLNKATYAQTGSLAAAAAATSNTLSVTVSAPAGSGTYALGYIQVTSGPNAGFTRLIRSWVAGTPATFTLIAPFPYAFAGGEIFTAYPGCNRQLNTCALFGNTINFGGEPFIPAPETAL